MMKELPTKYITLDFETYFKSKEPNKYSLKSMTYEEYIDHPDFYVFGAGIKIDDEDTVWIDGDELHDHFKELFPNDNRCHVIAHNAYFEAALLEWVYGVRPYQYHCTQSMAQGLWAQSSASLAAVVKRVLPNKHQKTDGLSSIDGVKEPELDQMQTLIDYCINDVDITFELYKELYTYYPEKEELIIDMTMKMWARRPLIADQKTLTDYRDKLHEEKEALLDTFLTREGANFESFLRETKMKKSKTKDTLVETLLAGRNKFPEYMKTVHNIEIPKKHSPTPKNPDNITWALGKKDLEFLSLCKDHTELNYIWDALRFIRGDDLQRTDRLLMHSKKSWWNPNGNLAVPLKVNGAHTKRWSGMNSVNFQNFKRKSPHRTALRAPEGHVLIIGDLSNIEARKTVWWCGQDDKTEAYRNGVDQYNEFASEIYQRPIDRKRKEVNELGEEYYPDEIEGFVGKVAILGLGFGMGPPKFRHTLAQGALGGPQLFFEFPFVQQIVTKYRQTHNRVANTWEELNGIIRLMADPGMEPLEYRGLLVEHRRIRLPSGLYLTYPGLTYDHEAQGYKYWGGNYWKDLWGGTLLENIIQALARIVMSDIMLEYNEWLLERNGMITLTVHDEIVATVPLCFKEEAKQKMIECMTTSRDWYQTLPLATEVDTDTCYSK